MTLINQIIEQSNQAVSLIESNRLSEALPCLIGALVQLKQGHASRTTTFTAKSEGSCHDVNADDASTQLFVSISFHRSETSGHESIVTKDEDEEQLQQQAAGQALRGCPTSSYFHSPLYMQMCRKQEQEHRSQNEHQGQPSTRTSNKVDIHGAVSFALIYNIALAMHMQAMLLRQMESSGGCTETRASRIQKLSQKALGLYQQGQNLAKKLSTPYLAAAGLPKRQGATELPPIFTLALLVNMAHLNRAIGHEGQAVLHYRQAMCMLFTMGCNDKNDSNRSEGSNQLALDSTTNATTSSNNHYFSLLWTILFSELFGTVLSAAAA